MRPLALLLLVLVAAFVRAADALILISGTRALPTLNLAEGRPSDVFVQAEWVLWPASSARGFDNRVLSIPSGLDWEGEGSDFAFDYRGGAWWSRGYEGLRDRGFFVARRRLLGGAPTLLVLGPRETTTPAALLLALEEGSPRPRIVPPQGPFLRRALLVYVASGWDDARALWERAGGRALVLEYPPTEGVASRYWLRGGPWPNGAPVDPSLRAPGLIRAGGVLKLILDPARFSWRPTSPGVWGGPLRWLYHVRGDGPFLLLAWAAAAIVVFVWGAVLVMTEHRSPALAVAVLAVALFPAALVATGAISAAGGLDAWPLWLAIVESSLVVASLAGIRALRRFAPAVHPLFAPCALGLALLLTLDPVWSIFSPTFGYPGSDGAPEAFGAMFAYLVGSLAYLHGGGRGAVALSRLIAIGVLAQGVLAMPWWSAGHPSYLALPVAALLIAEGLFRPMFLIVLVLLPTSLARLFEFGVAWAPGGLIARGEDARALDLARYLQFLVSPALLTFLFVAGAVSLFGSRFFFYQAKRLLASDRRRQALFGGAAACAAVALLRPEILPASLIALLGGLSALLWDGLTSE